MEVFEEYCRENAINAIKSSLLQSAIIEKEGILITEEVYKEKVEEYKNIFGYETVEEFEATYTKETITNQILADKAMAVLVNNAVPVE